jgi:hypothetical protein
MSTTRFFSTEWEETHEAGAPSGPITRLLNEKVGVFYKTFNSIDRKLSDENDFSAKALPLIYEATLAKRPYGFCEEKEKAIIGTLLIREGRITPITTDELLNEFPTRISDRIDRILLNIKYRNGKNNAEVRNTK